MQRLINKQGDPLGFASLASHLNTHEPYNLLQRGVLHTVCSMCLCKGKAPLASVTWALSVSDKAGR